MTNFMRAVYEYQTKAEYFLTDGDKAEEQFLTIPARKYASCRRWLAFEVRGNRLPGLRLRTR
jgi:hypothetical protein